MVVFASDNGYYLGEHGLGDKRSAYEESLRIPLLVRYPRLGTKGRLVDQMALNIDLAPTLLDFAGVAVPKEMHGRSWRPLLEGRPPADWRRSFFYCYFFERNYAIPTGDRRPHRDREAHQVSRPRRVDRGVRSEDRSLRDAQPGPRSGVRVPPGATGGRVPEAVGRDLLPIPTFADDPRQAGKEAKPRKKRKESLPPDARELIPYLADAVPGRIQATLTLGDTTHLSGKWHLGDKPE